MSKRVLIIDDEEHIRQMMRLTLEAAGYEVGEAKDGPEGLGLYGKGAWDVVALDQRMPGMDGATLLRHIRACDGLETIPAVALTAHAMKADRDALLSAGFNAYLSKPITDDELLFATIKKQMAN